MTEHEFYLGSPNLQDVIRQSLQDEWQEAGPVDLCESLVVDGDALHWGANVGDISYGTSVKVGECGLLQETLDAMTAADFTVEHFFPADESSG